MTALTLNIYTSRPRHEVLETVKSAVSKATGWIVAHQLFSNKAATIRAAIEKQHLNDFIDYLVDHQLADDNMAVVQSLRQLHKAGDAMEVTVACAMTFVHDEPDLKQPVPAVPG